MPTLPLFFPRRPALLIASAALALSLSPCFGGAEVLRDIEYAKVGNTALQLDLYLPAQTGGPLIVYVHGGAWRAGSKTDMPLKTLVEHGYAVASVDYRLSTVAPFPAQIHDIKAAIRFLRAKASQYHYDGGRIIVSGSSAGGHLAALVAVSNGNKELEGHEGGFLDQSSDVQAAVSFYGASNLQSILSQSTEQGLKVRKPALQLLLGAQPDEKPELARLASPVAHVNASSPPLLLLHGDQDPQMPPQQAQELKEAYDKAGRPVKLVMIPGAKHGGKVFYDKEHLDIVEAFLASHLPVK